MIKFENVVAPSPDQWRSVIMGARNAMNSWDRCDSFMCSDNSCRLKDCPFYREGETDVHHCLHDQEFVIGPNDYDLMMRLRNAGTDHRKFMRMVTVYVDITAPLYW